MSNKTTVSPPDGQANNPGNHFDAVINQYRTIQTSSRDLGNKFERLMQAYLRTDRLYTARLRKIWLWSEFPYRGSLGDVDLGIDLVAWDDAGEYWAVQCKCYAESAEIDKKAVDSFISASGRSFTDKDGQLRTFGRRLWLSTTNKWTENAEKMLLNQTPPFTRLNLDELRAAAVDWQKLADDISGEAARLTPYKLRDHQNKALTATHEYFKNHERGKLIMACGTDKTITALRIAEHETQGSGGLVLFLVPSLALMGQTLREWSNNAVKDLYPVCVCSDVNVTKKVKVKYGDKDEDQLSSVDLALPATTCSAEIAARLKSRNPSELTVIFSTYQSLERVQQAQQQLQAENPENADAYIFALVICDEAHRTAGVVKNVSKKEAAEFSKFTRIHDKANIAASKRLYMTATAKVYGENVKKAGEEKNLEIYSMDDPGIYGEEIYHLSFGRAVEKGLLTDYKVIVFAIAGDNIPPAILRRAKIKKNSGNGKEQELQTEDLARLIGAVNALSKKILGQEDLKNIDPAPMRRAVAFCENIKKSEKIAEEFNKLTANYETDLSSDSQYPAARHVDGTMPANERDAALDWLKAEPPAAESRILTNVRCLSEGVDVPALDAVLFLAAKNSQVEVVQSVGRVMRRAAEKKYGYIIIPVFVPAGMTPEQALDNNERYKVVWQVCNALRSHDERFAIAINQLEFNKKSSLMLIGGADTAYDRDGNAVSVTAAADNDGQTFSVPQLEQAIYAKIVQKCGDRQYWTDWAADIGAITERQSKRLAALVKEPANSPRFEQFLQSLRAGVNPNINGEQAVEMLAMHTVTKPVFAALFGDKAFTAHNPVSIALDSLLGEMTAAVDAADEAQLRKFYNSVRRQVAGITDSAGRQELIRRLYDSFFDKAFTKLKDQLGIVYTPVQVVDFILHSVNDLLRRDFGRSLADGGVKILDPFTGTGTFISRLLADTALIPTGSLKYKYQEDIFANEIVLLAYYIAAVNIENTYQQRLAAGGEQPGYKEFPGICLTDTFAFGESKKDLLSELLPQNSARVTAENNAPITVIVGNPPYSVGQKNANDHAKNQLYPRLRQRIKDTYVAQSPAGLNKALYDAYIQAFRWASDRLSGNNIAGGGDYRSGNRGRLAGRQCRYGLEK